MTNKPMWKDQASLIANYLICFERVKIVILHMNNGFPIQFRFTY
jgi:hypothetical protein